MTTIEWTEATWNPVRGCSLVSPGCRNCYAMKQAHRFSGKGQPYEGLTVLRGHGPVWTGHARFVPARLGAPLHWKKSRRIFVNSMSDLFHEDITDGQIAMIFGVMAACPQHTFQVLTKRAERMREWFKWLKCETRIESQTADYTVQQRAWEMLGKGFPLHTIKGTIKSHPWPLLNVWLGVSCEDQNRADERIPMLLQCPAIVRFVSAEPLLGPISLRPWLLGAHDRGRSCNMCNDTSQCEEQCRGQETWALALDWVIVGAESGHGNRPMQDEWVRSIRDQCVAAGAKFFFKQRATSAGKKLSLPMLDGRRWAEF